MRTFFADELVGGGAEVVVKLPCFYVVHPPDVHAVLVALPVVWLVGAPREKVLHRDNLSGSARSVSGTS